MQVLLIRHGETAGNSEKRYVGKSDEPLSAKGMRQVQQMGACAEMRQVFVSPLSRAVQTARLLFPQAQLTLLPGLQEMDFGLFEGRTAEEMCNDDAYQKWLDSGCAAPCPGGEGLAEFSERVCAAFAQAARHSIRAGATRLAVVAHGGTVMAVMSRLARPAQPYFYWQIAPASGYRAVLNEHTWEETPMLTDYVPFTELRL